jgi:putative transposase
MRNPLQKGSRNPRSGGQAAEREKAPVRTHFRKLGERSAYDFAFCRGMPRPLRLHFAHAIYHVINRGNYRTPIFASAAAAQAFERCLFEAMNLHRWRLHAFALMRNHYHLAAETPEANLTEGVHWLQSTFATRFNRYRKERGHLFQGRYYFGLVQPGAPLFRVVSYIHLNPVRAKLTDLAGLATDRRTSLRCFLRGPRPEGLTCAECLRELNQGDDAEGWQAYLRWLAELAADPARQKAEGFDAMEGVWAIGEPTWCRDIAASVKQLGVLEAPCGPERDAIRAARWAQALELALLRLGRTREDLRIARKGADWKVALAAELRATCDANYRWLARELHMGRPSSVRAHLCSYRKRRPDT